MRSSRCFSASAITRERLSLSMTTGGAGSFSLRRVRARSPRETGSSDCARAGGGDRNPAAASAIPRQSVRLITKEKEFFWILMSYGGEIRTDGQTLVVDL